MTFCRCIVAVRDQLRQSSLGLVIGDPLQEIDHSLRRHGFWWICNESGYPLKSLVGYNPQLAKSAEGSVDSFQRGSTQMCRAMERLKSLMLLLLLAGCCGTQETRLLRCMPRNPAVEAQSYNLHDPFPDEEAGPNTFTRPRAFMEPRSDTRKNLDLRYLKAAYGFPQQRYSSWESPTTPGRGLAQYPVQPIWRTQQATAPITTTDITW